MTTYTMSAPDVPHAPPFDPVRRYSIHWVSPGYLYALGGSIFSAVGQWCECKQYVGYLTALCEIGGAR